MKVFKRQSLILVMAIITTLMLGSLSALACSRVVYHGLDNIVLTGRNMDWKEDMGTHLWAFPREMKRSGMVGPNSLEWTSKYGSVIAASYDLATADGLNEKGLVANVLWLAESTYPQWELKNPDKPGLSIAAWPQYVLDSFSTVAETVAALRQEKFAVVTDAAVGTAGLATMHLSVSDATGDSAIFEYIDGKLVIHHDRSYTVMTNSPTFAKQLALDEYWQEIGGTVMLPGTHRAADRFVRGSFYINSLPQVADIEYAIAATFSVIRNISAPFGIKDPIRPNVSATRWRTVADHKNKIYFFESTQLPNIFWVELNKLDFSAGSPVRKLTIDKNHIYAGNTSHLFETAVAFKFQGLRNIN